MEKKVFIVAADFVAETAKVVAGQLGLNLAGWFELAVAAIALATLIYWAVKLVLAIPLVKHLAAAAMAFAVVEAGLSTVELFGAGFGLSEAQIFGAALAVVGVCCVLSIRRSRREARALKWEREYNTRVVADKLEEPKPAAPVAVENDDEDDDEVIARRVASLWNEAPHIAKRLQALEVEVERMKPLLGAQHGQLPEEIEQLVRAAKN
ncbi:hypothetical protein IJI99_03625 [bacterium]|nr:hypothetical protein [bacterium]